MRIYFPSSSYLVVDFLEVYWCACVFGVGVNALGSKGG